jgi:transposase-like protein
MMTINEFLTIAACIGIMVFLWRFAPPERSCPKCGAYDFDPIKGRICKCNVCGHTWSEP